ncbi:hypothetical protein [Dyella subtropica]|uniref:hypothetical protein n=1 Tax=Dyella subtropica TaxID=2992127 RepID=UPI0022561B53|nr:hypothetical protein [Dyella subtropica]
MVRFSMRMLLGGLLAFGALGASAAFAADVVDDEAQQAALEVLVGKSPPKADSVKGIALATWTHGPVKAGALWVVAVLVQPSGNDSQAQVWAGVLSRDDQGFHLLAGDRSERIELGPILWNPSLTLDLIPYRISDQETAFGVRFSNSYTSTAHSDTQEVLSLYRYADGAVTPIFTALTDSSGYDRDEAAECAKGKAGQGKPPTDAQQDACDAANMTEQHYALSFSPHITNGHYDVLVRAKSKAAPGKTARFSWNGKSYQPRRFEGGL